jgi:hypothetical protein
VCLVKAQLHAKRNIFRVLLSVTDGTGIGNNVPDIHIRIETDVINCSVSMGL